MKNTAEKPLNINISFSLNQKSIVKQNNGVANHSFSYQAQAHGTQNKSKSRENKRRKSVVQVRDNPQGLQFLNPQGPNTDRDYYIQRTKQRQKVQSKQFDRTVSNSVTHATGTVYTKLQHQKDSLNPKIPRQNANKQSYESKFMNSCNKSQSKQPSKESDGISDKCYVSKQMSDSQRFINMNSGQGLSNGINKDGVKKRKKLTQQQHSADLHTKDKQRGRKLNEQFYEANNNHQKQKSANLHSKSYFPPQYNLNVNLQPHHVRRYSNSQNLRKKSRNNVSNLEKSSRGKNVVYSNSYVKSVLQNPMIMTQRKLKNNSIKNFINELVKKQISRKTLFNMGLPPNNQFPQYLISQTKRKRTVKQKKNPNNIIKIDQKQTQSFENRKKPQYESIDSMNFNIDVFQQFVDRLSSTKSMECSILNTDQEDQRDKIGQKRGNSKNNKKKANQIPYSPSSKYVQTEQSILIIKQIKEFQRQRLSNNSRKSNDYFQDMGVSSLTQKTKSNAGYTQQIIKAYVAMLKDDQNMDSYQFDQNIMLQLHAHKQKTQIVHSQLQNPSQNSLLQPEQHESNSNNEYDDDDVPDIEGQSPIPSKENMRDNTKQKYFVQIGPYKKGQNMPQIVQLGVIGQTQSQIFGSNDRSDKKVTQNKVSNNNLIGKEYQKNDNQENLNKFQLQKWKNMMGYMMKNINSQADKKQVLSALYSFLGQSSNHLDSLIKFGSIQQGKSCPISSKQYKNQQTQKHIFQGHSQEQEYSDQQENTQNQYANRDLINYFGKQIPPKLSQNFNPSSDGQLANIQESSSQASSSDQFDIQSIKSLDETQESKLINLAFLDKIFKDRYNNLMERKSRDIISLQEKEQLGKISRLQLIAEKRKIQKWVRNQTKHIMRAKKNIWKGYNEVKGIIGKNQISHDFETLNSNRRSQQKGQKISKTKMMKCLSDKYISKKRQFESTRNKEKEQESSQQERQKTFRNQTRRVKVQQSKMRKRSQQEQEQQNSQDHLQNDKNYDEEMDKIKQRLLKMKQNHIDEKDSMSSEPDQDQFLDIGNELPEMSPTISYEEVDREFPPDGSKQKLQEMNQNQWEQLEKPSGLKLETHVASKKTDVQKSEDLDLIDASLNSEDLMRLSNQRKLKYLCQQDKQDIFQFIFLDLCIELYQEPCLENRIMKSVNGHIAKMKRQAKKNKGVRTSLNIVKEYLKRFQAFVNRADKQCLENLNTPMGPTAYEMLRYMRESDDSDPLDDQVTVAVVVPVDLFDKFERSLLSAIQFETYFQDEERQSQRIQFLKNVLHIHNKAIFDALNQSLDHERPFGLWGIPFPWKKRAVMQKKYNSQGLENKFKKCCENVAEYCAYVCGLLTDKQQSLVGNAHLSQQYLMSIRQDRLSRMLANDLIENQERWLFFDDQEAQVLVEIGRHVLSVLFNEACRDIFSISKKKQIQFSVDEYLESASIDQQQ